MSSYQPALKYTNATYREAMFICSTQAISGWRRTRARSQRAGAVSLPRISKTEHHGLRPVQP